MGDSAELSIVPKDLEGTFDYVADVKSMASGATEELMQAREKAMDLLLNNQNVVQLLALEGYKPNVKELITNTFTDLGLKDADRYFEKIESPQVSPAAGGVQPNIPVQGLPGVPQAGAPGGVPQQMAQPGGVQVPQGVPQGIR